MSNHAWKTVDQLIREYNQLYEAGADGDVLYEKGVEIQVARIRDEIDREVYEQALAQAQK